jgi:hypothetical protein
MYISVINVFSGFRPQQIVLVEIRLPPLKRVTEKYYINTEIKGILLVISNTIHLVNIILHQHGNKGNTISYFYTPYILQVDDDFIS